jgi:hypothetical protein
MYGLLRLVASALVITVKLLQQCFHGCMDNTFAGAAALPASAFPVFVFVALLVS